MKKDELKREINNTIDDMSSKINEIRITSYNVCYTKLLRLFWISSDQF